MLLLAGDLRDGCIRARLCFAELLYIDSKLRLLFENEIHCALAIFVRHFLMPFFLSVFRSRSNLSIAHKSLTTYFTLEQIELTRNYSRTLRRASGSIEKLTSS